MHFDPGFQRDDATLSDKESMCDIQVSKEMMQPCLRRRACMSIRGSGGGTLSPARRRRRAVVAVARAAPDLPEPGTAPPKR